MDTELGLDGLQLAAPIGPFRWAVVADRALLRVYILDHAECKNAKHGGNDHS